MKDQEEIIQKLQEKINRMTKRKDLEGQVE